MNDMTRSHIIISAHLDEQFTALQERLHPQRVVGFIKDDFLIEDAKAVVNEAYISEASVKYIVLAAKNFTVVAQNSLLKVLEEPPKNIEFIIIAPTKSILLPTVRSRLPLIQESEASQVVSVDIRLASLDLSVLFDFVKAHDRLSKHDAKALIEGLFHQASVIEKLTLTTAQLSAFERAYRLVELNGRFQNILLMILMQFLPEKRRAD